jgi:pimeloyl-ACP methyl ester carboxylesterase
LGIFAASFAAPKPKGFNRKRILIHGRPWFGLRPPPKIDGPLSAGVSGTQYFDAKVDNFDATNPKTYKQRYWYNDQWYAPGGPVFLMIGGESAESSSWVSSSDLEWTKLAVENKAMVFILEHRYYGGSQPTGGDMSTANLKFLSSQQALADVAAFIKAMNTKFNLSGAKWLTFGGSYSGALAAWSRMLYPDVIYGAVGSSGPVQAVVDFTGYLEVVKNALNTYDPKCATSLQNALAAVATNLGTASGRQALYSGFNLCQQLNPADSDQIANFYSNIIGNYMIVVQYSQDNAGPFAYDLTIPKICQMQMDTSKTDLQRMQAVNNYLMSFYGESCVDIDYNDFINYMQQASDDRAWVYQTCAEFGFYQTTDSTSSFYGNVIPINWYVQQCAQIYGSTFTNGTVYQNIAYTNSQYKGQNGYNATRVVLPNGTNDPWHVLGVMNAPNSQVTPILITGTSHCADMYADNAGLDPASLTQARAQVRSIVNSWLQ